MISKEVEYAKRRMQQKWYEFVREEQRGGEIPVLERMYGAYMLAVEEFNRYSAAAQQSEQQTQPMPTKKSAPPGSGAGKKKAS